MSNTPLVRGQFPLASLLVAFVFIALGFWILRSLGPLPGAILVLGFAIVFFSQSQTWRMGWTARVALGLLGLSLMCLSSVDWIQTRRVCIHCRRHEWKRGYRILTIPVRMEQRNNEEFIEVLARDLGVPCPHHFFEMGTFRLLSGFVPIERGMNGSMWLDPPPDWYPGDAQHALQWIGRMQPERAWEFREKVLMCRPGQPDFHVYQKLMLDLQQLLLDQEEHATLFKHCVRLR